jgi:hypothetical protein
MSGDRSCARPFQAKACPETDRARPYSRRHLCDWLAGLPHANAAVPLWTAAMPAAIYGMVAFPLVWALTEQMTYNGYLALGSDCSLGVRAERSRLSRSSGASRMS